MLGQHIGGGGSSTVKCYMMNQNNPMQALNVGDFTVKDSNDELVAVAADQVTIEGQTVDCVSFTCNVGAVYTITNGESSMSEAGIAAVLNPEETLPSVYSFDSSKLTFIAANTPMVALIAVNK